ncbi:DUF427 domain-containing protein [Candidatus Bipolaricaulota bacterium]
MKATWNGEVIAESDETIVIENNHYFPPESVKHELLRESSRRTTCPWKGEAHYFDIIVGEEQNRNAAWAYPQPKEAAAEIKDHVAFWRDVEVTSD